MLEAKRFFDFKRKNREIILQVLLLVHDMVHSSVLASDRELDPKTSVNSL